jgi:hypothetical protein
VDRPLNRPLTRAAAAAVLLMSFVLGSATPVLADCQPVRLEEAFLKADSVFVGTVTGLSNGGRWATVAVDEVWAGPSLAPVVEVRGGAAGNRAAEDDRSFVGGVRYFFAAYIADGGLIDNGCSATREWEPALAKLRPAASEPAAGDPFNVGSLMLPAALVLMVGVVVFGAVRVLGRRS